MSNAFKEALIDQHSALVDFRLAFAERDETDMEVARNAWRDEAEWLANERRNCTPSCYPIENLSEESMLDHAVMVGEAVLRDFVSARNFYDRRLRNPSRAIRAEAVTAVCWGISDHMRGTGLTGLMRWGTLYTALCLEYVILDQVEILFEPEFLSRKEMRNKIDDIRSAYGSFYWSLYNENRGCRGMCGTIFNTFHLTVYSDLLEKMLRDIVNQRTRYRL